MLGAGMSEEKPIESNPAAPSGAARGGRRRGRRGGRGRRRPAPVSTTSAPLPDVEPPAEPGEASVPAPETPTPAPLPKPRHSQPASSPPAAKRDRSAVSEAVEEVRQIVESLEQALEQMEEVLRLVEQAEHQKSADDRELESLRRALHRLQPPHRQRREEGG